MRAPTEEALEAGESSSSEELGVGDGRMPVAKMAVGGAEARADGNTRLLSSTHGAPEGRSRGYPRALWAVPVAVVTLGLLALLHRQETRSPLAAAEREASTQLQIVKAAPPVCPGEGGECHSAGCCADGGDSGYQCWAKNEYWAVCLSDTTCKPGVHPGEKHGTYDQYGTFHLDEWSCEKLGNRSLRGCENYQDEENCTSDAAHRCEWFRTGKCLESCSRFSSQPSCPTTHCVWSGSACETDPCSGPGEDCGSTGCCSSGRYAAGQKCYTKDDTWATCMDTCDNVTNPGWECKALGNRTKMQQTCAWAGHDCSPYHLCCNSGHSCALKDEHFQGCMQTIKKTTWTSQPVPLPGDWNGKILGGARGEYAIQPVAPGGMIAGTSMYCFMAILPKSPEEALLEVHKKSGKSIFACNASAVFHSWQSGSSAWDTGTATLINTDVFINVWEQVHEDGRYLRYDWTVKVDADAAFVPDRLRSHLWQLRAPPGTPIYLKNTAEDKGLSNGQFLGAIEILSKKAVQTYFDLSQPGCKDTLGTQTGEDGYLKGCLDALGVGFMSDGNIMKPDSAASFCSDTLHVAFHPLKCPQSIQMCYDLIDGKPADWGGNLCPGATR